VKRIAVVSDPHGNLPAFEAVVADVRAQAVDEVLLGGDLAQGGRQPGGVLDLIAELGWPAVLGNADLAVLEQADRPPGQLVKPVDDLLRQGLVWTMERLRPDQLDYLRGLPRALRRPLDGGDFVLVHATPWSVEDVLRPDSPEELARRMLAEAGTRALAYGHIHHAYQRRLPEGLVASVGAVSGSSDRDHRPAYSIFTLGPEVSVEVRRVEYDVAAEVAAIEASGYPLRPGRTRQMLEGGTWPVRS
jgi:predicted phosphodiesterase